MEEKLISAWRKNREEAVALGVRMRPIPEENPIAQLHRLLTGNRVSDGFARLSELGRLDLSPEALAVDKRFTSLFSDEEANNALTRLLDGGYNFR